MTQRVLNLRFDPDKVKAAPYEPSALGYLLARLVRGETVAETALSPWGIEIAEFVIPDRLE